MAWKGKAGVRLRPTPEEATVEARVCKQSGNQDDSPQGKNHFLRRFRSSSGSGTHLPEVARTVKRLSAEPQAPRGLSPRTLLKATLERRGARP